MGSIDAQSADPFYADNAALVDIINKTTSRDPTIMVHIMSYMSYI